MSNECLSRGNKLQYLCSVCNSPSIVRCASVKKETEDETIVLGLWNYRNNRYYCLECNAIHPWRGRRIRSLSKHSLLSVDAPVDVAAKAKGVTIATCAKWK